MASAARSWKNFWLKMRYDGSANERDVAFPPGAKEETFTIANYDNIDRQEETSSGISV